MGPMERESGGWLLTVQIRLWPHPCPRTTLSPLPPSANASYFSHRKKKRRPLVSEAKQIFPSIHPVIANITTSFPTNTTTPSKQQYLRTEANRPKRRRVHRVTPLMNVFCHKSGFNSTGMTSNMESSLGHEIRHGLMGIVLLVTQFWVAVDLEGEVAQVGVSLVDRLEEGLSRVQLHRSCCWWRGEGGEVSEVV